MKHQALFSSEDKSKKLKCRLLQFLFGALRVDDIFILPVCALGSMEFCFVIQVKRLLDNYNGDEHYKGWQVLMFGDSHHKIQE